MHHLPSGAMLGVRIVTSSAALADDPIRQLSMRMIPSEAYLLRLNVTIMFQPASAVFS